MTLRGVDTGSGPLRLCAVDRHSQRAAWCPGRFLRLMFTQHERSCLRKIMVGHRCTYADMSTRQVHALQLQRQRSLTFLLTPMKCPHLLSHEMTGQVHSSALDQFLSYPHVVSYSAVVSSCSAKLCSFCREGWAAIPSSHSLQL